MANAHRGEISAQFSGKTYRLCLTLGALAELEQAQGAEDLIALVKRFESAHLSARDLLRLIGAGLRGGGHDLSDVEVAQLSVPDGVPGYVRIAAELLAATFGATASRDTSANPSVPQNT